jgi:hypothetical protein
VFEYDALLEQRVEYFAQHGLGNLGAAREAVVTVDQDFGLDDRHDALLLADRRIARQRMRIGLDRGATRLGSFAETL